MGGLGLEDNETRRLGEAADKIVTWCAENRRPLPWRCDPSPYHVWVSEIMLQQTRIETVVPYYLRFLEAFPSVEALAAAPEEQVLKLWEGLGYYSRARRLRQAAEKIVAEYGGALPRTADELCRLPGIGRYTAGAIASMAYGEPEPAVDGNVLRVLARLFASEEDVLSPSVQKKAAEKLRQIYPTGSDASLLTEGLMELGEIICIPNGEPVCALCPIASLCLAREKGIQNRLPVRRGARVRRIEEKTILLLNCGDLYAIRKREGKGLLAGMWEFPSLPGVLSSEALRSRLTEDGITPLSIVPCGEAEHIFTHIEWHMVGYRVLLDMPVTGYVFETADAIRAAYAVPSAFRFFLDRL